MVSRRNTKGFTLIELMIVVAIVGILAAIALPAYREHVIRGNRSAAQAQMLDIANREQQYLLANREYADYADLGYTVSDDVAKNYTPTITVGSGTVPSFTITFTAKSGQVSDGDLILDSEGNKTRDGDADKWNR